MKLDNGHGSKTPISEAFGTSYRERGKGTSGSNSKVLGGESRPFRKGSLRRKTRTLGRRGTQRKEGGTLEGSQRPCSKKFDRE